MSTISFLAEIFVEELPFSAISREIGNVGLKFERILGEYHLRADVEFFWTPRRLILHSKNLQARQDDMLQEFFGPPLHIAYDESKNLTPAGKSFLKKANISAHEVKEAQKDGKTCLYYATTIQSIEAKNLIENILLEWLESLHFGKSMQWGSVEASFIRPIRNVFVLLGNESLKTARLAQKYQFNQTNIIAPHRSKSPREIENVDSYFEFLQKNGVIYSQDSRKARILEQIKEIECAQQLRAEIDDELLREIVAINEFPTALFGRFDAKFLELPLEVVITSMKINQKYFAIYKENLLHNGFIVICNTLDESAFSEVVAGNERVLRARLEDALFFYKNDIANFVQNGTDARLKDIEFIEGLGSVFDKVQREIEILKELMRQNAGHFDAAKMRDLCECMAISKNDLVSEMVGEFGELQGIMSSHYTINLAWREFLREQYLPLQENSALPGTFEGALIAIAHKLDTILALFSIGKIPSGSKDPFALRRNANGVLKIIQKFHINLNLDLLFGALCGHYQNLDSQKILQFLSERMDAVLDVNPSIVHAALKSGERNFAQLILQIEALDSINKSADKDELRALFKRVANILISTKAREINPNLFCQPQEIALFGALQDFRAKNISAPNERIFELLKLKNVLKDFFDNVLILSDDEALKENRVLLVKSIYEEFFKVGDIREISF